MKPTLYFLTAFVAVSIAISVATTDAQYAVVGIVIASTIGAIAGLLKAPEA